MPAISLRSRAIPTSSEVTLLLTERDIVQHIGAVRGVPSTRPSADRDR